MLQSLNPDILRDFRDKSVLGFFNKKLRRVNQRKDFINYELECLMRGDVPIFYQYPLKRHLYDGDGKSYGNFFVRTAHEELTDKWKFIKSDAFLRKNVKLLKKITI